MQQFKILLKNLSNILLILCIHLILFNKFIIIFIDLKVKLSLFQKNDCKGYDSSTTCLSRDQVGQL